MSPAPQFTSTGTPEFYSPPVVAPAVQYTTEPRIGGIGTLQLYRNPGIYILQNTSPGGNMDRRKMEIRKKDEKAGVKGHEGKRRGKLGKRKEKLRKMLIVFFPKLLKDFRILKSVSKFWLKYHNNLV